VKWLSVQAINTTIWFTCHIYFACHITSRTCHTSIFTCHLALTTFWNYRSTIASTDYFDRYYRLSDYLGLASISIWSQSDRREYTAITCDQLPAWSWSLHHSTKSLSRLRSQSSAVQYKLGLTGHLETVTNCTVMHATWRGGWEMSQHQQPVVRGGGDQGVSECTVRQWVVAETNSRVSYYQTDCSGGQATCATSAAV